MPAVIRLSRTGPLSYNLAPKLAADLFMHAQGLHVHAVSGFIVCLGQLLHG